MNSPRQSDPKEARAGHPGSGPRPPATLSEALAALTDVRGGGLQAADWSTIRWMSLRVTEFAMDLVLPSGRIAKLGPVQGAALRALADWAHTGRLGGTVGTDTFVVSALPDGLAPMGVGWIRAVIDSGTVTYGRYVQARSAYENEVAEGRSHRSAWARATAVLRGGPARPPGRPGPRRKRPPVPDELVPAWERMAERLQLAPATAQRYRSALRRLFEVTGGTVPEDLDGTLSRLAAQGGYCASVASAFRALARSASVEGVELPAARRVSARGRENGRMP